MKYSKLFGWGIVIYAVMYLTWSFFVAYGFVGGIIPRLVSLAALLAVTVIAARSLHFSAWKDILPYSIAWAVMIALLDGVLVAPYAGWKIYSELGVWLGYAVVVIAPLFFTDEISVSGEGFSKRMT